MTAYRIRPATVADAAIILRFIRELADYENALDEVAATEETVAASLFGEGSVSFAAICETEAGEPAGSAVWFKTYSTWQAKNGLYLEDLYVTPAHRGAGVGKMLLRHLARIAVEEDCARFEWSVLDWNEPAIRVYEAIGAEPHKEWVRYRLAGDRLKRFAEG
ncbi:GNAT family N-acetyltransferase [Shinella sp. PSBB067]|uniref:GNAT family N-acetyltransferase n=1 Tax=Shinella sp. PSBB067 TaxID=2715959 RepID=UPI00193BEC2A|nr:GNAT family N-acetyltransferase [Shinella sp. PSBB067]MBN9056247.1 GNAT family N-acetyltransferase [Hyphomicrobiales bacterium]QRI64104.1 GNAT family N-acetyltransferase [Shinella sp. PSBB067]